MIQVHDKHFEPYIDAATIQKRVLELCREIDADYKGLKPLFIGVLNGSFIFAADLFRHLTIEAEISFVKLASYKGTTSTGHVVTAIGLEEILHDRHVVIVEDIVDTGKTLTHFREDILRHRPASVKIASFLTKPEARQYPLDVDYLGFEIPNRFVVGYGLDYDGLGRNLPDLFQLAAEPK